MRSETAHLPYIILHSVKVEILEILRLQYGNAIANVPLRIT